MVSKSKFLGLSFLLVVLFPLLPKIFGNNSQHILILGVTLAGFNLILNWKGLTIKEATRLLYFKILLLLLLLSFLFDFYRSGYSLNFNNLLPLTKPIYLGLFFLLGYATRLNTSKIIYGISSLTRIFVFLGFTFSIAEIYFLDYIKDLLYLFFKREERGVLLDKSTTWFGVTYYSGFFWLMAFMFSINMNIYRENKKRWVLMAGASLTPLLLSQSRTIIVAFLLGLFIMFIDTKSFVNNTSLKRKLTRLPLFIVLTIVGFYFFNNYYSEIKESFGYVLNTFELLITGDFYLSGSLMARLDQVIYAIDTNKNVLIGWGLGRELPLESIYSAYYYRYGLVFLIITITLILSISLKMRKLIQKNPPNDVKSYCKAMYLILIVSPIAFFASPILETPKIGLIYFFLIGFSLRIYENTKYYNSTL